jgi:hypothetical protein
MNRRIQNWEILYSLLNSWGKALLWLIPLAIGLFASSLNAVQPYLDWRYVITFCFILFAVTGYINLVITNKIDRLRASIEETVHVLREDRNRHIEEVSRQPARSHPDGGRIQLREYNRAIESIRANGFVEFECERYSAPDLSKPMMIFSVAPGMNQYFMVGAQESEGKLRELFLIAYPDVNSRDLTVTWFENIFQILGHTSPFFSEMQESWTGDEYGEYREGVYYATKYKCIKQKGKHFIRIFL